MSVVVDGYPAMRAVDQACANCGSAVLYSGASATLSTFETRYVRSLVDKERAFVAAVASGRQTDAASLALPQPGELDDIGLSARIWKAMMLNPASVDRNALLSYLRLEPGQHRFIDVPGPLASVRLDDYAVSHLEEDRYERWDLDHVGFFPLVESTLKHPFEIWCGIGSQKYDVGRPNYRFLSLYQLDAGFITHVVIYSSHRKKVVTSHKLSGWPRAMAYRSGTPIFAAYVR